MVKTFRKAFLVTLLAGIIAGITSGVATSYYVLKTKVPKFVTVDVKKIVEDKKYELLRRLQDKNESSEKLETEYKQFLVKLDTLLTSYMSDKSAIFIRKEALIDGNYKDITDEIKKKMKDTSDDE